MYDIHCLVHLANKARLFGPLDNCSSFPFENYLQRIKRCIRSGNKPLQQLPCGIFEKASYQSSCPTLANSRTLDPRVVPSSRHSNGLGFSSCNETFKKVIMDDCTLNGIVADKYVLLSGSRVFGVSTFIKSGSQIMMLGHEHPTT